MLTAPLEEPLAQSSEEQLPPKATSVPLPLNPSVLQVSESNCPTEGEGSKPEPVNPVKLIIDDPPPEFISSWANDV